MAITLTIAGSSKQYQSGSLNISEQANGRSTLRLAVKSTNGSYRPAQDATVVVADGATTLFAGLLYTPSEAGINQRGNTDGIITTINAVDYHAYAERRYVNETLATGTLKSQLTTLVANYLSTYGVTLHGSQVNGPTMPELVYEYRRLDEVLNELATITADAGEPYIWRIDTSKVLRMYQPSTTSAPFNIVSNSTTDVRSDITVETTRVNYANRIILKVTPKRETDRIETFTGDGTAGPFTLTYTVERHYGHLTLSTGGGETLANAPAASGVQWELDSTRTQLTRLAGNTTVATVYSIQFDGVFNGSWTAEDAGEIATYGPWERVIVIDSIPSGTTGQQMADAFLAKSLPPTKTLKYRSFTSGLATGQSQTVTLSRRNLSGTAVITEVVTRDVKTSNTSYQLVRDVTAVIDSAHTNLERGWRDVYRVWAGDKAGGSTATTVAVGSGSASSGGPAPPFTSVQYNRSGSFGGEDTFTFDEDGDSLVCGGSGSDISAGNPQSCQVFGSNCHII